MDFPEAFEKIENAAMERVRSQTWMVRISEVATIIVFPLLWAFLLQNQTALQNNFWYLAIPMLAINLLLGILVLFATKSETFYFEYKQLYEAYQNLQEENQEQQDSLDQTHYTRVVLSLSLQALINFVENSGQKQVIQVDEVKEIVTQVFKPLVEFRNELFWFGGESRYNFTLYLFSENDRLLKVFHRDVDGRIIRKDRAWEPGRGHVGLCFAQRKLLFSPDILQSAELLSDMEEGDKLKYRSFISAPILQSYSDIDKSSVRGVFVVTSSEPDQLDQQTHEIFIKSMTIILAMIFSIADKKLEKGVGYV